MTGSDDIHLDQAYRRIHRVMLALGAAGTAVLLWKAGWQWSLGFAAGAGAAALNLKWLEQFAAALGPSGESARRRATFWLVVRYLLLAGGGYAIVMIFGLSGLAILIGLLVSAAAVLLELIYELVHAGT